MTQQRLIGKWGLTVLAMLRRLSIPERIIGVALCTGIVVLAVFVAGVVTDSPVGSSIAAGQPEIDWPSQIRLSSGSQRLSHSEVEEVLLTICDWVDGSASIEAVRNSADTLGVDANVSQMDIAIVAAVKGYCPQFDQLLDAYYPGS